MKYHEETGFKTEFSLQISRALLITSCSLALYLKSENKIYIFIYFYCLIFY